NFQSMNYVTLDHILSSNRRRQTISKRDWSSDVCSSNLEAIVIIMIPTIMDQSPKDNPIFLNKPICNTSQEPTPNRCPLTVSATPSPITISPTKKNSHRKPNSFVI